jgi:hypothetical protein
VKGKVGPVARTLYAAGFLAVLLGIGTFARADSDDNTAATSSSPSTSPDKSGYTLFNPTPDNLLREMTTDRPDKTDEATTIDAGHLQIETGVIDYTYNRDKFNGDNELEEEATFGDVDFRLGALDYLEFDVEVESYNFVRNTDYDEGSSQRNQGFGDVTIGEKLNFWGNDSAEVYGDTAFGLIAEFKIPTAKEPIGNEQPEAFFGFPFSIVLPAAFEFGAESIVSWERNADNTNYTTGFQNMVELDHDLFGDFNVFAELWTHFTTQSGSPTQMSADFGFTFPVANNVILDTGVFVGLNHATDSLEATSGITVRF